MWSSECIFIIDGNLIERVGKFRYLFRMMDQNNDYWIEVLFNIRKEKIICIRIRKLLTKGNINENIT